MNFSKSHNKTDWQTALVNAVTTPQELFAILQLDTIHLAAVERAAKLFPLKVPHSFIARMEKNNINDPLLRQVLPLDAEFAETIGYSADALDEAAVNPIPGLLHKYKSRVLLIFVGTCAVNCRYCFRRDFPYAQNNPGQAGWNEALNYIANDTSIKEVILSGGDPLVVSDAYLKNFIAKLAAIPHLIRLRIHSRLPIVLPERVTADFIQAITETRLKVVMVVHCNHAQEVNHEVKEAMRMLKQANILLLNQSVLLKGVNDDADTLVALSEALFDAGVQPYYLNALDKVKGIAHFDLSSQIAQDLHWAMMQRLPGYLIPKLVYEKPGAPAKLPLLNLYTG